MSDVLSDGFLANCARKNPRLALWVKRAMCMYQPQAFQMHAEWVGTNVDQAPLKLLFDQPVPDDIYVIDVTYDVTRPATYGAGSIFVPEQNWYNALNPGIKIRLSVEGGGFGDQFTVNAKAGPIQNLIRKSQGPTPMNPFPTGWCLTYQSELVGEAFLSRALAESEVPYILDITVMALRLGCKQYGDMREAEAVAALREEFPEFRDVVIPSPARQWANARG